VVLLICFFILATKATAVLRSLPSIQRIVYVLGRPDEQAMHNFYEYGYRLIKTSFCVYMIFCFRLAAGERSKLKSIGGPFIPTNACPVDLLPHTTHTEIVVKCVRV
jgi:hypothetical protein